VPYVPFSLAWPLMADLAGAFFWRMPLPASWLGEEDDAGAIGTALPLAPVDFWRLPLQLVGNDSEDDGLSVQGGDSRSCNEELPSPSPAVAVLATTANEVAEVTRRVEVTEPVEVANDNGHVGEASGTASTTTRWVQKPKRNLAEEMTAMLDRYVAERGAFQRNLAELVEMQERLRALTVKAAANDKALLEGETKTVEGPKREITTVGSLMAEVVDRILWLLDFRSLGRATCAGREWARLAREKPRWRRLCEADWGTKSGSWQEYRNRLNRWHSMRSVISSLKGSGCPSGICGSLARKRLFEALEALAELGAAPNPRALYPAQVPTLMRSSEAGRTLVALLEDESPHLLCLSVRCLADLATDEDERPALRESIVRQGALLRSLLEGDDDDVVEASSRMMLNLHSVPGAPIRVRRRGPDGFTRHRVSAAQLGADQQKRAATAALASAMEHSPFPSSPSRAASVAAITAGADSWSGAWAGEMRYARGGERHAELRLVLGLAGDPKTEQATAAFLAAYGNGDGAGSGEGDTVGGGAPVMMHGEGGNAEYWRYFGFLAVSDFDCAKETVQYIDEVIERRRQPSSPSQVGSPLRRAWAASANSSSETGDDELGLEPTAPAMLTGAGWDGQNGAFEAEALVPYLPPPPSSSASRAASMGGPAVAGSAGVLANAVPLRLRLKYHSRGSTYELTGFLAEGTNPDGRRVPTLYGVWATTPSHHRHLFVLRRAGPLPIVDEAQIRA